MQARSRRRRLVPGSRQAAAAFDISGDGGWTGGWCRRPPMHHADTPGFFRRQPSRKITATALHCISACKCNATAAKGEERLLQRQRQNESPNKGVARASQKAPRHRYLFRSGTTELASYSYHAQATCMSIWQLAGFMHAGASVQQTVQNMQLGESKVQTSNRSTLHYKSSDSSDGQMHCRQVSETIYLTDHPNYQELTYIVVQLTNSNFVFIF